MARPEGKDRGLFERSKGSGVWWIRYHDAQGKEHREKVGSKSLAREVYHKRKAEVREGRYFPEKLTRKRELVMDDLVRDYLEEAKVNHRCFQDDVHHSKVILEAFGGQVVKDIQPAEIERWKRTRLAKLAPATVMRDLSWLRKLFNVAMRDGHLEKNPVKAVQLPKINNTRVRYLSDPEEVALKNVMRPDDFLLVELALHTGLRRAEQFELRWENVDFRTTIITIPRSKNGEKRHVPMNARAIEILRELKGKTKSPWVIPSQNPETPLDPNNFMARVFVPALKMAGIQNYHWHDNRHTFASRLAMAGVELRSIMELMGHKSMAMTMRYAHLSPSHLKEAVSRLLPRS